MISTEASMDQQSQQNQISPKSYSAVTNQFKFPSRQLALVFSAIENTPLHDYLIPLGNIVQPKNITFASRLSNHRVCMYLANKNILDELLANHGQITIRGELLKARRLITPAERIVMSQ
uniref:Uncharacterized protein LOC114340877 n=1 Tax=Diabrotica virgifera virgifera TaxID=50390 RepID=A0A6P7GN80_DIAVI